MNSTTTLDVAAVVAEYNDLPTPGDKARMRATYNKMIAQAVRDQDLARAMMLQQAVDGMKAPTKSAPEVDYERLVADRIVNLRQALRAVEAGNVEGLPEDVTLDMDRVQTLLVDEATLDRDLVVSYRTLRTRKSTRGDVGAFIASAVEAAGGTFQKVSVMRRHRCAEYGDEAPSAGAIAAALKTVEAGDREIAGVAVAYDEQGRLGAIGA